MQPEESFGLKEDWQSVEDTLRTVIPVYDRVNRFISLGSDLRMRKEGLDLLRKSLGKGSFSVLDLGCGPGKMTEMLLGGMSDGAHVSVSLLAAALVPMVRVSISKNRNSQSVASVYESLPFWGETMDAAMAGFAIRDAKDLRSAMKQTHDILRPKGLFLIVDLCKPNSKVKRGLVGAYWRLIAPAIAFLAAGRLGLKFAALSKTFERLPTMHEFVELTMSQGFTVVESSLRMLDGACILLLQRTG